MRYTYGEIAGMIDHSLLHPRMTNRELEEGCVLAAMSRTASACIRRCAVRRAAGC